MPRVSAACAYTPFSALPTVGGAALPHHAFILVRGAFHRHNANGGLQEQLWVTKQLLIVPELLIGQAAKFLTGKTADKEIARDYIVQQCFFRAVPGVPAFQRLRKRNCNRNAVYAAVPYRSHLLYSYCNATMFHFQM